MTHNEFYPNVLLNLTLSTPYRVVPREFFEHDPTENPVNLEQYVFVPKNVASNGEYPIGQTLSLFTCTRSIIGP